MVNSKGVGGDVTLLPPAPGNRVLPTHIFQKLEKSSEGDFEIRAACGAGPLRVVFMPPNALSGSVQLIGGDEPEGRGRARHEHGRQGATSA